MDAKATIPPNLELLLDVRVELTIELGSCRMPLREILQLAPGSVVKLDQAAQHPVNLFVNHKQIARGEVVVVNDCYGVKITVLFGAAQ
jgi:flagellar motor switch protein FliN/FliY